MSSVTTHTLLDGHEAGSPQSATGQTVLAVCGFIGLAGLYVQTTTMPDGSATRLIAADLAFIVPIAVAVLLGVLAAKRMGRADSRVWKTITATNAVLLVSEIHYVLWIARTGTTPPAVEWSFQWLHVLGALLFLAVVAALTPLSEGPRLRKIRWYLDVAGIAVIVYVSLLFLLVRPLFSVVAGSTDTDALVGTVYTSWGVLVLAGLAWAVLQAGWREMPRWRRLASLSVALYALGISAWPLWYCLIADPDDSMQRRFLDVVLILSHYLVAIAAARALTDPRVPISAATAGRRGLSSVFTYVVLGIVALSMPAMTGLAIWSPAGSLGRAVYAWGAGILALLAIARTTVAAVEGGRLFRRTVTDPLTGLHNHRYFHERCASLVDIARRTGEPLSVIVFDVDDFERVNDNFGHPAGDDVLRGIASALREECRRDRTACRIGGDEFAILLPRTEAPEALQLALRVHEGVRGAASSGAGTVTLSSGIAACPLHSDDAEELIRLADGASYWVKAHGKDQTLLYDPTIVTELNLEDRVRALEESTQLGTVRALAQAVDSRHEWTHLHSVRVAALCVDLAHRLGMDEERCRLLEMAAMLHDVGMVALTDDDIAHAGELTAHRRERIRRHPDLGAQILGEIVPGRVRSWVRHHEERWDGSGYPDGLRAVGIPLEARIIAVCGAWDAMLSHRPYREAMTPLQAIEALRAAAGTQFDPSVVEAFLTGMSAKGAA